MEETTPIAEMVAPMPEKKKRIPAPQDQIQMNWAGEVEKRILTLEQNAEAMALVAKKDVTPASLAEGKALVAGFQGKYSARQQMLSVVTEKLAETNTAWDEANDGLVEFRGTVRLAFPDDKAAQQALGATGKVPQDQEKFLIVIRASATAAKSPDYAEKMAKKGHDSDAFDALIDTLSSARATYAATNQSAQEATAQRDEAFKALKKWSQLFYRATKLALKKRPDLLGPLGL